MPAQVEGDAGQHAEHLLACFVGGDAFAEVLFAQLRALQQRHVFEFGDFLGRRRQRHFAGLGDLEVHAGGHVHQGGEFAFGELQVLAALVEQHGGVEQGALVGQGHAGRDDLLRLGLARAGQRQRGLLQHFVGLGVEALSTQGAPVGGPHVLQHVLHDFAPALFGDEELVALLTRAVVGHAEVQRVPAEFDAAQGARAFIGGGGAGGDFAVEDADAGAAGEVVALAVACAGHHLGQHVVAGVVGQALGQRGLHFLEAVVQVVFEGTRHRFFHGDGGGDGGLAAVHLGGVVFDALAHLVLGQGLGGHGAAGHQRGHGQHHHAARQEGRGLKRNRLHFAHVVVLKNRIEGVRLGVQARATGRVAALVTGRSPLTRSFARRCSWVLNPAAALVLTAGSLSCGASTRSVSAGGVAVSGGALCVPASLRVGSAGASTARVWASSGAGAPRAKGFNKVVVAEVCASIVALRTSDSSCEARTAC
ncbi:hypothetical protein FQZ97_764840 [compost metagenome]